MKPSSAFPPFLLSLAGLSTGLAGVPAHAAAPGTAPPSATFSEASAASGGYHDGTYKGRTFSAYYGRVQVSAKISNGELVYVGILRSPTDYRTSRVINSRALPELETEVISAQSAQVDTVSGATLSSMAFLRSLRTALERARSGK